MSSLTLSFVPLSALHIVLTKWTLLLLFAWGVHALLAHADARWRRTLWRVVLSLVLLVPIAPQLPIPLLPIALQQPADPQLQTLPTTAPLSDNTTPSPVVRPPSTPATPSTSPTLPSTVSPGHRSLFPPLLTAWLLQLNPWLVVWGLGALVCVLRLLRFHHKLFQLAHAAQPAPSLLASQAASAQSRLLIHRPIPIHVSTHIVSPFVCGLFRPRILLPSHLAAHLPPIELNALLNHELAHVRSHDLLWTIAWRWTTAILWFHPLAWFIPAAHSLACEEEADRVASRQQPDPASYAKVLAQLALRVLRIPNLETHLTVNGSSQIALRLRRLESAPRKDWPRLRSLAAFSILTALLWLPSGWQLVSPLAAQAQSAAEKPKFKEVVVTVQSEDGKPIEGALLQADGLRVQGDTASHYGWPTHITPRSMASTDAQGHASLRYPVHIYFTPGERLITEQLSFTVTHSDFVSQRPTNYRLDGKAPPVRLIKPAILEVSGYFGPQRTPILNLKPQLGREMSLSWDSTPSGVFTTRRLPPGDHLIQLHGLSPNGELIHADPVTFSAKVGRSQSFNLELKPGIRLEGKIEASIPRPIQNGRVIISVRPPQFPAHLDADRLHDEHQRFGEGVSFWTSHRRIEPDGSFVFESLPPGEVDVVIVADGYVSKNGGQARNRNGIVSFGVPQSFALNRPTTQIEVLAEPTATVEVLVTSSSAKPLPGVQVSVNPNLIRMQTGLFGFTRPSDEAPFIPVNLLPNPSYSATTDVNGRARLQNLPAFTQDLEIYHADYESPDLQKARSAHAKHPTSPDPQVMLERSSRRHRIHLTPGATLQLPITLAPKPTPASAKQ